MIRVTLQRHDQTEPVLVSFHAPDATLAELADLCASAGAWFALLAADAADVDDEWAEVDIR